MPVVSVTRLRLGSMRFLPAFIWRSLTSARQARRSPGFLEGLLANEGLRAFWTVTVWESLDATRAFRDHGAHRAAMPRLLGWCDEASFTHWEQPDAALPSLEEAHRRLAASGRTSKVSRPSPEHAAGRTASGRVPRAGQRLLPSLPRRAS